MINTEDIETKLEQARKDGKEYQTDDDVRLAKTWEEQLQAIKASASFLEHPETKRLLEAVYSEIARINSKLTNERTLPEVARQALFDTRDFCDKLKGFLECDPERSLDDLEADIDKHVWQSGEGDEA